MELRKRIQDRLDAESRKNLTEPTLTNVRDSVCEVDGCGRKAYASNLCNAHYIRKRKGLDLSKPIRYRTSDTTCVICPNPVDGKGGYGMCKSHYRAFRRKVIKDAIIEHFGGCCAKCGGIFHPSVYDLHHIDSSAKEGAISNLIQNASIDRIIDEVGKCVLLCSNCHRIVHNDDSSYW